MKLSNDSRNITLSPEYIRKSDLDIKTIFALNSYAKETGNIFILSGGYAAEAHCGGIIHRPHGDIDGYYICLSGQPDAEIFATVASILNKEETKWSLRKSRPDKVEYLENDDSKSFFDKRRLDFHLYKGQNTGILHQTRHLFNSIGESVKIEALDLSDLVASKIHKFFAVKDAVDTATDRHSSKTDYDDLNRLLQCPNYDRKKVMDYLTSFGADAQREYDFVLSLLKSYKITI